MSLDKLVRSLINPQLFFRSIEDYNKVYFFIVINLISNGILVLPVSFMLMSPTQQTSRAIPYILYIIISLFNISIFKRKANFQVTSHIFILSGILCIICSVFERGIQQFSTGSIYFIPMILMSLYVIEGIFKYGYAIFCFISVTIYFLWIKNQPMVLDQILYDHLAYVDTLMSILASSLITHFYVANQIASKKSQELLMSVIFHDIGTPLSSLLVLTEDQELNPKKTQIMKKIVLDLSRYLNTLKTLQKVNVRSLKINQNSIKISKLIPVFTNQFEVEDMSKDKKLVINDRLKKDIKILGDFGIIQNSIIANIFNNIKKYSKDGSSVTVDLALVDKDKVQIIIKDESTLKIAQEVIESINSEKNKNIDEIVSSGFGLPIVKSFMILLGGDFKIEQDQDFCSFILTFSISE